jgi:hypothetical protein
MPGNGHTERPAFNAGKWTEKDGEKMRSQNSRTQDNEGEGEREGARGGREKGEIKIPHSM